MNERESNRMNMYRVVAAVLSQYAGTIDTIEVLARVVAKFLSSLIELDNRDLEYKTVASGVTAMKNSAADTLVELTLYIANALYVFGRTISDEHIKAECRLTPTRINVMSDSELQQYSTHIAELTDAHVTDLVPYGIAETTIAEFKTSIESFNHYLQEHHLKHAESKAAREMLYKAFDTTNEILKEEVDVMIELIKTVDIELYNKYQAARVIKDIGGHSNRKELADEHSKSDIAREQSIMTTPLSD